MTVSQYGVETFSKMEIRLRDGTVHIFHCTDNPIVVTVGATSKSGNRVDIDELKSFAKCAKFDITEFRAIWETKQILYALIDGTHYYYDRMNRKCIQHGDVYNICFEGLSNVITFEFSKFDDLIRRSALNVFKILVTQFRTHFAEQASFATVCIIDIERWDIVKSSQLDASRLLNSGRCLKIEGINVLAEGLSLMNTPYRQSFYYRRRIVTVGGRLDVKMGMYVQYERIHKLRKKMMFSLVDNGELEIAVSTYFYYLSHKYRRSEEYGFWYGGRKLYLSLIHEPESAPFPQVRGRHRNTSVCYDPILVDTDEPELLFQLLEYVYSKKWYRLRIKRKQKKKFSDVVIITESDL